MKKKIQVGLRNQRLLAARRRCCMVRCLPNHPCALRAAATRGATAWSVHPQPCGACRKPLMQHFLQSKIRFFTTEPWLRAARRRCCMVRAPAGAGGRGCRKPHYAGRKQTNHRCALRAAAAALSVQPQPAGPALWFAAPPCLRPTSVVLNLLGALRAVADVVLTARRRC